MKRFTKQLVGQTVNPVRHPILLRLGLVCVCNQNLRK